MKKTFLPAAEQRTRKPAHWASPRSSPACMYAIIAAVRGCGFFSVGLRLMQPREAATYTATYTESADKNLQTLARS
ncbi:MAG: hypothetical protein HYY78_20935 [Betaproteobacteria bacterium]|nr:hypothetical protein [Betaproteobacteria bacterium]